VPCGELLATPPTSVPPPAAPGASAGAPPPPLKAGSPPPPPAAAAAAGAAPAGAAGRRLQGAKMCTQYLREIHFLKSAALMVVPPPITLPNKTRWKYEVNPCGNEFTTMTSPVDEPTWHMDVMQGGDALWCYNWTALFDPPSQPATLTLRSVADPYVAAGLATNCSFIMPRTPASYLDQGLGFLIPGVVVSTVAYFFLAGVCELSALGIGGPNKPPAGSAPLLRARAAAAAGDAPPGGPAYGTATAVELTTGRRAAPAAPGAV
jgi:hypothetical protein